MLQQNQALKVKTFLSLADFKAFFQKSLGNSRLFDNIIWSKVRRDTQYQQKEIQDWAFYLEHLQSILFEFDTDRTSKKATLICLFREGLKLSIKAQIEQCGRKNNS